MQPVIYSEPAFDSWNGIVAGLKPVSHVELRKELIAAALEYSNSLAALADSVGIKINIPASFDPQKPIVMAGHQPLIYHPGIQRKNIYLQALGGQALNLQIDLDEADAGVLKFPALENNRLVLQVESLTNGQALIKLQKLKSKSEQQKIWQRVKTAIESTSIEIDWQLFDKVSATYISLADKPIAESNTIVRALIEPDRSYLEIPLSILVRLPQIRSAVLDWCKKGKQLSENYNQALAEYRIAHRIKGNANPFPDLKISGSYYELPFWFIAQCSRSTLWTDGKKFFSSADAKDFKEVNPDNLSDDYFISPRGALVSLLYREFCCDLFIHGLGGQTYDSFTNEFAKKLIAKDLPLFVVASETRYLFPTEVSRVLEWEALNAKQRDIISHTKDYLSVFPESERAKLAALTDERDQLIPQLQAVAVPADKVPIGKAIKLLSDQIKHLTESRLSQMKPYQEEETRKTWFSREYPVFFRLV